MPRKSAESTEKKENTEMQPSEKKKTWVRNKQENFGEENVKPGDNSRYLRYAMVSLNLPPIDISDAEQVENRIKEYFSFCIDNDRKPNMIGMANWLGVDNTTVNSWKRGEYRSTTHSPVIIKAVRILEEQWVDYMQNGKINPASGIFLAKNMFQYRDAIDIVPTQAPPLGQLRDQKALEAEIEALPEADTEE